MFRFYVSLLMLLSVSALLTFCASQKEFTQFAPPSRERASLYIYRPFRLPLMIYSDRVDLYRYEGTLKEKKRELVQSYTFHNGQYLFIRPTPGFYSIITDRHKDSERSFYFEKNKSYYINIIMVAKDEFTIPRFYVKEESLIEAAGHLSSGQGNLKRHPGSEEHR